MKNYYPPSPNLNDTSFLNPTPRFLSNLKQVFSGILLFVVTYSILILVGIFILYVCILGAFTIVSFKIHWITIALALGLIAFGVMFFVFLIKFIFVVRKNENELRFEIKEEEHPVLFQFINQIADDVKSPKPKKIFLIPDVNASVFYNSSFWSMFLPVRKNLQIGLGLVNSVNISEFKAVLAHEFGHFSQRSMKMGSYVYTVNQIIYNLVYSRDNWDKTLDSWANNNEGVAFLSIFSMFASITRFFVNIVRKILESLYKNINKRYMGLSREMEFNADLIAVSIAGKEALITALRRLEVGHLAYNRTLEYLNSALEDDKLTDNIYQIHTNLLSYISEENGLATKNGLPIVDDELYSKKDIQVSRVNYRDQWASHPTQADREFNVNQVDINSIVVDDSPWRLFDNTEKYQKKMTARLYLNNIKAEKNYQVLTNEFVISDIKSTRMKYQFPEKYHNFYQGRMLFSFDTNEIFGETELRNTPQQFEEIYNIENIEKINLFFNNKIDMGVLEAIRDNKIDTESFDFDGEKHEKQEVDSVIENLINENEQLREWFENLEKKAYQYNFGLAQKANKEKEYVAKLNQNFLLAKEQQTYTNLMNEIHQWLLYLQSQEQIDYYDEAVVKEGLVKYYERVKLSLENSSAIEMKGIRNIALDEGYFKYLLKEPLANLSKELSNERFLKLYDQVATVSSKASNLYVESVHDLTDFQATL